MPSEQEMAGVGECGMLSRYPVSKRARFSQIGAVPIQSSACIPVPAQSVTSQLVSARGLSAGCQPDPSQNLSSSSSQKKQKVGSDQPDDKVEGVHLNRAGFGTFISRSEVCRACGRSGPAWICDHPSHLCKEARLHERTNGRSWLRAHFQQSSLEATFCVHGYRSVCCEQAEAHLAFYT